MELNRADAFALLCEYTKSENLIKHALAVEACMRWYARHFSVPQSEHELWGLSGLLHDLDWERHPDKEPPNGHPFFGERVLAEHGYPEVLRRAVLSHANYSGVPRDDLMSKTLYAVDELSGLVTASVLVRPDRSIHSLENSSVRKKMKDKAFAKGCNREEILQGAADLGIDFAEHVQNVIYAMREKADELGLAGAESRASAVV